MIVRIKIILRIFQTINYLEIYLSVFVQMKDRMVDDGEDWRKYYPRK